nr:hypothetical protein [uncultured Mediterranean phage uvMED]
MSNEYVGGLDVNLDIPDIANPDVGFNIRNPFELWFEESLPASLYQYISGNTKQKQAIEARKKIKELDPKSKEWAEQFRIYNKYSYTIPESEGGDGGNFDVKELAKFMASHPEVLASEFLNAALADPYLFLIPWVGWGKLGANVTQATRKAISISDKAAGRIGRFNVGAVTAGVYGGAYQLSEDEELGLKRTIAEVAIGGTANMVIGGMLAGAASKTSKASGIDNETTTRIIKEAVEASPDDPIPEIAKRFERVLKEQDAPDIEVQEISKMINTRLRDEMNQAKDGALGAGYNWKTAGSVGGIAAFAGFLTADDEKVETAATAGLIGVSIPVGFRAIRNMMFKKPGKMTTEEMRVRQSEFLFDELTQGADGAIESLSDKAVSLNVKIKETFDPLKREAFVFARQSPDNVQVYNDTSPKIKKFKWNGDKNKGGWARYNKKSNTIFIDEDVLIQRFNDQAWNKPKVEGVIPLPKNQFKTLEEWRTFVIGHEKAHTAFKIKDGESRGAYENRINQIALGTPKNGDFVFTWNKFDRNTLMEALAARDAGKNYRVILDKLEPQTVVFKETDMQFLNKILPEEFDKTFNSLQRGMKNRVGYIHNYIAQEWEMGPQNSTLEVAKRIDQGQTLKNGTPIVNIIGASGSTARTKTRLFLNYDEGIELGFIPKSNQNGQLDIADVITRYQISVGKAVIERNVIDKMRKLKLPSAGTPGIIRKLSDANPDHAADYVPFDHPLLNNRTYIERIDFNGRKYRVLDKDEIAYVHKSVKPYLQQFIDANDPGAVMRAATNLNFFMKRMAVGGSFFHAASLGESLIFVFLRDPGKGFENWKATLGIMRDTVTGRKNKFIKWQENPDDPSFIKHLETNYVATVDRLGQTGSKDIIDLGIKNGLKLSKPADVGHDSFYASFTAIERMVQKAPLFGKVLNDLGVRPLRKVFRWFDKITWERAFTSGKLFVFTTRLNQLILKNPSVEIKLLARDAAKFANDAFGGQSMMRSANDIIDPTIRRMAQETLKPSARPYLQQVFFAPDWTLSNINILARGFSAFNSNERTRNLYMSYLINGAILYATLANAIQYAFTGKSILENKDPTRIDLGNGEVITFSKQYMEPFHWITDPQKTLIKKVGSLPKTVAEIMTNKKYMTTGWSPQITKKDMNAIDKALALTGQAGKKFLPIWMNQAVESYMEDGLTYDDAVNFMLGQLGHPKYKAPRSSSFKTRGLTTDPMKVLF